MYSKFKIQRIHKKKTEIRIEGDVEDYVVLEKPIHLFINQKNFASLIASPKDILALVWGHLLSEGLIKSKNDVQLLVRSENQINIQGSQLENRLKAYNQTRIITTQCGATGDYLRLLDSLENPVVDSSYTIPIDSPFEYYKIFQELAPVHSLTGGTHFAALIIQDDNIIAAEDISRHNCIDKVIGKVILENNQPKQLLSKSVLLTTGRIPADMLLKAARANIPIIASRSAPTDSAIHLAEELKIALICFLRRYRFNIYSCKERIVEKKGN